MEELSNASIQFQITFCNCYYRLPFYSKTLHYPATSWEKYLPKYDDLTSKSQYFVEYFSQDVDVEFWRKKSDDSNSCRNEKREKVLE